MTEFKVNRNELAADHTGGAVISLPGCKRRPAAWRFRYQTFLSEKSQGLSELYHMAIGFV